jgi:multiple sugar transport system substrate-binding protein
MDSSRRMLGIVSTVALIATACSSSATAPPASATAPPATSAPTSAPVTSAAASTAPSATAQRFDGVTLNVAAENDQYAPVLKALAPQFEQSTGAKVVVDVLGYPEEYQKITADFVAHTGSYDVVTTDIVWTGQFAQSGWTVDLTSLITRDSAEINKDDFYAVDWALGGWQGKQVAFPFVGYAMLLNYNKSALSAAGLQPPQTMEDLVAGSQKLTNKSKNQYGITINGQKGSAGAQDFMTYNNQLGGKLLDANGKPTINSAKNIANLQIFKNLFQYAPPGAVDYDWGPRETSFKQGIAMMQIGASIARPNYEDPTQSKIVGNVGTELTPVATGLPADDGFEGWGIAINKDSKNQDAAWAFIKWATSPSVQKEMVLQGSGSYIRKSTLADPELVTKFPWQPQIAAAFTSGDADFRPRVPQYPQLESIIGTQMNLVLHGSKTPQQALNDAQAQIAPLFP